MTPRIAAAIMMICCWACTPDRPETADQPPKEEIEFNPEEWKVKTGRDYPHRDSLLQVLIDDRILKPLDKEAIFELLGPPDRVNENYLYYTVSQRRIVNFWPLHTKTLVVVLSADSTGNKVLIHE